eukprot:TRINITY_DN14422_c0_g1_i1.p1 TRINITY_DN14422_c0_g1~~TRINITY_DN14422_c0_g1_i1.p1  ORF type:complete len:175 (-),score=28.04 TRINITY_DN14422_c0_g1_i1:154-618(-)
MKSLFIVFVALIFTFMVSFTTAHTCNGIIINDSNYTLNLVSNNVKKGTLNLSPPVQLDPHSQSKFQLTSTFGLSDRIIYTFGYAPDSTWCPSNPSQYMTGSFSYNYGDISCTSSTITCRNGTYSYLDLSYQNCNGLWSESNPTFTIYGNGTVSQ